MTEKSPLAPARFPSMPFIDGLRIATAAAGVRYEGRDDVMLALLDPGATIAGVFTTSATRAAPVLDCQAKISGPSQGGAAIFVNAGNANAFTGTRGIEAVKAITSKISERAGLVEQRVFTASTGVIGEALPHERITACIDTLVRSAAPGNLAAAAGAICTTDTYAKGASAQVETSSGPVSIAGIAKGSGMIAPDMATMLVYIFTDAKVDQPLLQDVLERLCARTFNCITVDSDTSTSDTLMLAATGVGPALSSVDQIAFEDALHDVMLDLAHQVVRDGEGATKFVEVTVTGAKDSKDADLVARSIANSPLVKTAIAGEDPNWGRVVMAVGKSGAMADRDELSIRFGNILVAEKGWVAPSYTEAEGAAYMKRQDLRIGVDLGLGDGSATIWTCDLTHGYITINADYRS